MKVDKMVEPNSFDETKDQSIWRAAMKEEIQALEKIKHGHLYH
jgi:hypothetical protein